MKNHKWPTKINPETDEFDYSSLDEPPFEGETFVNLDRKILVKIFRYCSTNDVLKNVSLVCKEFRDICNSPNFFENLELKFSQLKYSSKDEMKSIILKYNGLKSLRFNYENYSMKYQDDQLRDAAEHFQDLICFAMRTCQNLTSLEIANFWYDPYFGEDDVCCYLGRGRSKSLGELKLDDLKRELKLRGQKVMGNKPELMTRLQTLFKMNKFDPETHDFNTLRMDVTLENIAKHGSKLEHLSLERTRILEMGSKIISTKFQGLKSIKLLDVWNFYATHLHTLSKNCMLQKIDINNGMETFDNDIDTKDWVEVLKKSQSTLKNLTLRNVDDEIYSQLSQCTNLEDLKLINSSLNIHGVRALTKLEKLKSLELNAVRNIKTADLVFLVCSPFFARLENLVFADMSTIQDEVLGHIANNCFWLKSVTFKNCENITDDGIDKFKTLNDLMYSLTELNLDGCCEITKDILEHINEYFPSLQVLNIANTQITGGEVEQFYVHLVENDVETCLDIRGVNAYRTKRLRSPGLSDLDFSILESEDEQQGEINPDENDDDNEETNAEKDEPTDDNPKTCKRIRLMRTCETESITRPKSV